MADVSACIKTIFVLLKVFFTFNNPHSYRRGEEHHAEQKTGSAMDIKDIVDDLVRSLGGDNHLRILLAGPCGVGKTQIAREVVSRYADVKHIEHDALKQNPGLRSPCSPKYFDPDLCFSSHLLSYANGFVIDIGGGSVFRSNADNEERLRQIVHFKKKFSVIIVLLTASRHIVKQRYLSCKDSVEECFELDWVEWEQVEQPYWKRCSDIEVDTA